MIYILIAVALYSNAPTNVIVEFNTREACLDAAKAFQEQAMTLAFTKPIVLCAAKGIKNTTPMK